MSRVLSLSVLRAEWGRTEYTADRRGGGHDGCSDEQADPHPGQQPMRAEQSTEHGDRQGAADLAAGVEHAASRAGLAGRHAVEEQRRRMARQLTDLADRGDVTLPAPVEKIASWMMALQDGLALQELLDPASIGGNSIYEALALLIRLLTTSR